MGCVALEITQRCNLDCTLCYLSEISESIRDIPLPEVFRRIETILRHYGPGTDVQVTGGDPTLRKRTELAAIVREIHDSGMRPSLMTNGIRASRGMLAELAESGLRDVAFHVDLTQGRKGYSSEAELNALRKEYLDRARGLPLRVLFNTTVFDGNISEIPRVVEFFKRHAGRVTMASFQLQADTGRSVLGRRSTAITPETVAAQISLGAGINVNFDAAQVGHSLCNRYAICLEAGGKLYNLFDDSSLTTWLFECTRDWEFDPRRPGLALWSVFRALLADPACWGGLPRFAGRKLRQMGGGLLRGRGRVRKLSFFIHNFMDEESLDRERCETCVFMVATQDGPLSMCVHNAKRDQYLLRPLALHREQGKAWWQPLTGDVMHGVSHQVPPAAAAATLPSFSRGQELPAPQRRKIRG